MDCSKHKKNSAWVSNLFVVYFMTWLLPLRVCKHKTPFILGSVPVQTNIWISKVPYVRIRKVPYNFLYWASEIERWQYMAVTNYIKKHLICRWYSCLFSRVFWHGEKIRWWHWSILEYKKSNKMRKNLVLNRYISSSIFSSLIIDLVSSIP